MLKPKQISHDNRRWLLAAACIALAGCQQEMARQPSYRPLESTSFFANGQASRPLVAGTVARGHLETDWHQFTGRIPPTADQLRRAQAELAKPLDKAARIQAEELARGKPVDTFPFPVNLDVLEHGYHRYMIHCVVCHDPLGTGHGVITERGFTPPPSYHIRRLREVAVGHIFNVVTEGYGSMPSYAAQIPARDRWAIAAYVRALQLSQHFPANELTAEMRQRLSEASGKKEGP